MNKMKLSFTIFVLMFYVISGSIVLAQNPTPTNEESQVPTCTLNPNQYTNIATSHGMVTWGETTDEGETQAAGIWEQDSVADDFIVSTENDLLEVSPTPDKVLILIIDDFSLDDPFSHGWDVLTVAQKAWSRLLLNYPDADTFVQMKTVNTAPHFPNAVQLDLQDNTAELLVYQLQNVYSSLKASYSHVILNMSFVFIPCSGELSIFESFSLMYDLNQVFAQYYESGGEYTFLVWLAESLLNALENGETLNLPNSCEDGFYIYECEIDDLSGVMEENDYDSVESFIKAEIIDFLENRDHLEDWTPSIIYDGPPLRFTNFIITSALRRKLQAEVDNPLQTFLAMDSDAVDGIFVPVAGAGNWGPGAAYAPGAWSTVISVGGSDAEDSTSLWIPTNLGEVSATAAWHNVAGGRFVSGTSFSTPLVSVMTGILSAYHGCSFEPLMDEAFDNLYYVPELWNHNNCNMIP